MLISVRPAHIKYEVMALIDGIVYWKLGLKILWQSWINFDLIWAVALLAVGNMALYHTLAA
jgi:hypothetical protein